MNEQKRELMFSSGNDEWGTPDSIFIPLDNKYKFTLDPCASPQGVTFLKESVQRQPPTEEVLTTQPKCSKFYTIENDGLSKDWSGETVFVNPPYSNIKDWIDKGVQESKKPNTVCCFLVPARTETKWFKQVWENASNIFFYHKRIKFLKNGMETNSAAFPSVLVEFDWRVSREQNVSSPSQSTLWFDDGIQKWAHFRFVGLVDHNFKRLS